MIQFPRPTVDSGEWGVVPFITHRKGERPALEDLFVQAERQPRDRPTRLVYAEEDLPDRPLLPRQDVLWARCEFSQDENGMPAGEPQWKDVHPHRQVITMLAGRCQVCTRPARTPLGWIFLAGPQELDSTAPLLTTWQPPVCPRHVRTTQKLCPHVKGDPVVILATSAPLYGVLGSIYGLESDGRVAVVDVPEKPLPFGDPRMPMLLGSQLVRRLSVFRVMDVDGLFATLEAAGVH